MVEGMVIDEAGTPQSYTAAMQSGQLRRNTLTWAFSLKCQAKWTLHFVDNPPQWEDQQPSVYCHLLVKEEAPKVARK